MEILNWIDRLNLGAGLMRFVDSHYFKHLLFVKLTRGSNINLKDVKTCDCDFDEDQVKITMTFKKKVDIPDLANLVEDNIYEFDFSVNCEGRQMIVTIRNTKGSEVFSSANILNSNA